MNNIYEPKREPNMIIPITDSYKRSYNCKIWFNGNEIIVCNDTYINNVVCRKKDGVWHYRKTWKGRCECILTELEYVDMLNEIMMQKAIEESMR